jgi:hypothetical protein
VDITIFAPEDRSAELLPRERLLHLRTKEKKEKTERLCLDSLFVWVDTIVWSSNNSNTYMVMHSIQIRQPLAKIGALADQEVIIAIQVVVANNVVAKCLE